MFLSSRNYDTAKKSTSIISIFLISFYKLILMVVRLNNTLLIHDNAHFIFFTSLMLMPTLAYAIKRIPQRWRVYEKSTMLRLDTYDY